MNIHTSEYNKKEADLQIKENKLVVTSGERAMKVAHPVIFPKVGRRKPAVLLFFPGMFTFQGWGRSFKTLTSKDQSVGFRSLCSAK